MLDLLPDACGRKIVFVRGYALRTPMPHCLIAWERFCLGMHRKYSAISSQHACIIVVVYPLNVRRTIAKKIATPVQNYMKMQWIFLPRACGPQKAKEHDMRDTGHTEHITGHSGHS
jgi:hypothetical protein